MKSKVNKVIEESVNLFAEADDEKSVPCNNIEYEICNDLIKSTRDFKPEPLFNKIYNFVNKENEFNRILFSEIYSYKYSLNEDQNSTFITNLDRLLEHSKKNKDKKYNIARKVIVKLYDHIHATLIQDEQAMRIFDDKAKEIGGKLSTLDDKVKDVNIELKNSEKNYITILGIFASFVVTFVGGLSFSSSVINGISSISSYRLFTVILLLGFVLMTICFSLYWFIAKIVNNVDINNMKCIYIIFTIGIAVLLFVCMCFWCNGVVEKRNKKIDNLVKSTYSEIIEFK